MCFDHRPSREVEVRIIMLLLLILLPSVAAEQQETSFTDDFVNAPRHVWSLYTDGGRRRVPLQWTSDEGDGAHLQPLQSLKVHGRFVHGPPHEHGKNASTPLTTVFEVANVTVFPTPTVNTAMDSLPAPMTVIVLMVDFSACSKALAGQLLIGQPPATTTQVRGGFFTAAVTSTSTLAVQQALQACSHGRVLFHPTLQKVVKVNMASCSATDAVGAHWQWNDCPTPDSMDLFASAVEKQAIRQGIDLSPYTYRWHVLSKSQGQGPSCDWAGMASQSCSSWGPAKNINTYMPVCRALAHPSVYNESYVWLHEIGHNLGLYHGAQGGREYGDLSTPMGGWGPDPYYRCYNLPQAVRLGAAKPSVTTAYYVRGTWLRYNISSAAFSITNAGVQIRNLGNTGPSRRTVAAFISYRTADKYTDLVKDPSGKTRVRLGGDSHLSVRGVLLHLQPDPRLPDTLRSSLEMQVGLDKVGVPRYEPYSGLVVVLSKVAADKRSVLVSVCRRGMIVGVGDDQHASSVHHHQH